MGSATHQPTQVRTTLYMMNQARGMKATVASPFKHTHTNGTVLITACAARDLPPGTELTWDYNPTKRFPWEPIPTPVYGAPLS
jgi:hypothetical protein